MFNKNNSKRITWIGIIITIPMVIFFVFGDKYISNLFNRKPSSLEILEDVAREINATCPKMIDSETRLDNVSVIPEKTFQYNFTIVNKVKSDMNLEKIKQGAYDEIGANIKGKEFFDFFRDNKFILNYSYKDINGSDLFVLEFVDY